MTFNGTDLYAALIHELKNDLGVLSLTIDGIPLQGEAAHDAPVDAARLLCQGVVDRLQQALLIYKAGSQPIHPASMPGRRTMRCTKSGTGRRRCRAAASRSRPRWRRTCQKSGSSTAIWSKWP